MKILILLNLFIMFNAQSQELKTEIGKIKTLIKSSKVGYENSYLIIAEVVSLVEITDESEDDLVKEGTLVEFLLDKSICYDEVKLALMSEKKSTLIISNLKKKIFKIVNKPDYQAFLIATTLTSPTHSVVGCKLNFL